MRKKTKRRNDSSTTYTEEELVNCLKSFYLKNGRISTKGNLTNNPEYPSFSTYRRRFKRWSDALKKIDEEHIENKEAES